jgi:hypothetical protein
MTQDHATELARIQALALDHAIEEMDAAAAKTLETQQDRGDRGWLTGMAAKSLNVAVKIEQFLALRGEGSGPRDEDEEEAASRLVKTARAEVRSIMERVGASKPG